MLSLLLTLFISLFSYCPSVNTIEDHIEDNITKNAFINEDEENVFTYVYTFNDIGNERGFWDIRDYFYTYGNVSVDASDTDMPINQVYTLPIRQLYISSFENFDYAAGYPYLLDHTFLITYIHIMKTAHTGNCTEYVVAFTEHSTPQFNRFALSYIVSDDFDYVIGCAFLYNNSQTSIESYCFSGITNEGNPFIPSMPDIFKNVGNRGVNEEDYERAYSTGYNYGYSQGNKTGYQIGYADGLDYASSIDTTASTIFEGIFDVGLLPVNVFLTIFNFDVFGVNIAGIVSGLLTLSVVVIIFRFLLGGKNNDK